MAAVIRPVCINHSDFGHSGVAVLGLKIILTEFNIVRVHCKPVFTYKFGKPVIIKCGEPVKRCQRLRYIVF